MDRRQRVCPPRRRSRRRRGLPHPVSRSFVGLASLPFVHRPDTADSDAATLIYAEEEPCHGRHRKPGDRDRGARGRARRGADLDHPAVHRSGDGGGPRPVDAVVRRTRSADRPAGPRQDPSGRDAVDGDGPEGCAGAVHARPDAGRHPRLGSPGNRRRRRARVPLRRGAGVLSAPDGRRDQPRLAPDPVGAASGDAGAVGDDRRSAASAATAVPCSGDAEPDRAGGHLSAARGATRPIPRADRRALSRPQDRARHPDGDHRRRRRGRARGVHRPEPDGGAASGAPDAGRRGGGRDHPGPRPRVPARRGRGRRGRQGLGRLGSRGRARRRR